MLYSFTLSDLLINPQSPSGYLSFIADYFVILTLVLAFRDQCYKLSIGRKVMANLDAPFEAQNELAQSS